MATEKKHNMLLIGSEHISLVIDWTSLQTVSLWH